MKTLDLPWPRATAHRGTAAPPLGWSVVVVLAQLAARGSSPHLLDEGAVFCAVRLRLQPAAGFCGLLSFGHAAFSAVGYVCAWLATLWPDARTRGAGRHGRRRGAGLFGWLAIRRSPASTDDDHAGAGAAGVLLALQTPFTGGEDGLQGVPRSRLMGLVDLGTTTRCTTSCWPSSRWASGSFIAPCTRPMARCSGHSRERAARFAGLRREPLQAACVRTCLPVWPERRGADQIPGLPVGLADRRALAQHERRVVLMTLLGGLGTLVGPVSARWSSWHWRTSWPTRSGPG